MLGFAHYFLPLGRAEAMHWAKITLSASILIHPFLFHSLCALVEKMRRFRWWITAFYAMAPVFLVLLWQGDLLTGLRPSPYMTHYVSYNRAWYPILGGYILLSQWFGFAIIGYYAWRARGYKRMQLLYFIVAWFIVFLTTNSIVLPREYDINVQPFGFFVLPLTLTFLAYVMGKTRLADFNVVISRVLLLTVTLMVVVAISLVFIGVTTLLLPEFMSPEQIAFTILLATTIGLALAIGLPRLLPRAERLVQERLFGSKHGYQDALAGLVGALSHLPTIDQVLENAATTVHSQMQLSRVLILMQDPLAGVYKVEAQSGLSTQEAAEVGELTEQSAVVRYLQDRQDVLVRDELARRVSTQVANELTGELNRLKCSVCVPMILEEKLVGLLCIGEKANHDMFFVSDLRLLQTLATEVALAVRYRRIEDEVFRKNKLISLGTIAAGVAHEIRNPLASIRTFAQLMPERMDDPEFKNEFSQLVLKDVDRITKVVETMLAFARPAQVTIKEQPVNELVDEAALLVQVRVKNKSIELTKQFRDNPVVKVDKQQILQVLVNLLNNAVDALPEHGKIRVTTGVGPVAGVAGGNGDQDFAVIEVADNGPGIPATVRARLFDPFFTTKKEGTGLGLSISQKIVRDHGGAISVSSVEGKGTTFQVSLPVS
jgi:two-component system nitrogen regulation sensor histidine kinase GlnL